MADVEVKLGADQSALKSGMDGAAANVAASAQRMREQMDRMAQVAADASVKWEASQKRMASSTEAATQQISKSTEKTEARFSALARTMIRTAAAAVGAWVGHKAIESVYALEESVEKLERGMGITSTKATQMAIALTLAGSSADNFLAIAFNMGRVVKTDSEEFTRLGVSIKDAKGNLLPMEQIMRNTYDRMLQFKAGTDQNMFALSLAGRSAKEFADTMENLERVQGRAIEIQKAFGVEMGEATQGKIKAFKTEVAAVGEIFTIAATKLAIELMPVIKDFGSWLVSVGPTAINGFIGYIELLRVKFEVMSAQLREFTVNAGSWFDNMVVRAQKSALTISMTINGQIAEVPAMWEAANARIRANNQRSADQVVNIWGKAIKNIDGILAKPGAGPASGVKSGSLSFVPKPKGGEEKSRMAEWEEMLKAQRDGFERMRLEQGSFERWSEAQTSAYWQHILDTENLTAKERIAVSSRYYDAERVVRQKAFDAGIAALEAEKNSIKFNYDERIRIAEEAARRIALAYGAGSTQAIAAEARVTQEIERQTEQRLRLVDIERRAEQQRADHGATMAQMEITQRAALGQISAQQAIAMEMDLQTRLYQIKRDAYEKERALERDPVKIAALNSQIEALEQTHQQRLTQLQNEAVRERAQASIDATNAARDSMSTMISDIALGTKSAKNALLDFAKSVEKALADLASKQLVKQLFGAGTGGGDFLSKIFGKIFGGGAVESGDKTAADAAEKAASAQVTAAKAAETEATTLLTAMMTPFNAAIVAATAALESMAASGIGGGLGSLFGGGGGGGLFSDFGGGDGAGIGFGYFEKGTNFVPRTMMAMVHKGEAVIPAGMNKSGMAGLGVTIHAPLNFYNSGPVDSRTRGQIAAAQAEGIDMAKARYK